MDHRSIGKGVASTRARFAAALRDDSTSGLAAVVAALVAAGLWLAASGMARGAEVYGRIAEVRAHRVALAPMPYQRHLPVAHELLRDGHPTGWLAVVRVDSVRSRRERRVLCETVAALDREPVPGDHFSTTWIALSDALPACLGPVASRLVFAAPGTSGSALASLRAELGEARWTIMDAASHSLYSRRSVPSADALRALAALAAGAHERGFEPSDGP